MSKIPQPWFRTQTGQWYVELNGRQIALGRTKTEVNAAYRQLLGQRADATHDSITFHALLNAFWTWYSAEKATTTVTAKETYRVSLLHFFGPAKRALDVTPSDIRQWVGKKKYAPSTRRMLLSFAQRIFSWGVRNGFVPYSPIQGLDKPAETVREDFVPPSLFKDVIRAAKKRPVRNLVVFMLDTGIRPCEINSITAERYNAERNVFVIPRTENKNRKRTRTVYLTPTSARIAKGAMRRYPTGPIFRTPTGKLWTTSSLQYWFGTVLKRLNRHGRKLQKLYPYMLRHSFAHYRLSKGQNPVLVSKLLGHSSVKQLFERYGHLEDGSILTDAAAAVRLPGRQPQPKRNP